MGLKGGFVHKILVKVLLVTAPLVGCAGTVPLAPGADQVKITKNPSGVTSCTALGNIDGNLIGATPDQFHAQMRNQAVGLGGNVVLDTTAAGTGVSGVIYRCR